MAKVGGPVNPAALTSIVGTGGVNAATIVPDLQSLAGSADVKIETDTSILNSNQIQTYDFTVYQRILNEIRSTSTGNGQIVLQPVLMGQADTETMNIELVYNLSLQWTNTTGADGGSPVNNTFTQQQLIAEISNNTLTGGNVTGTASGSLEQFANLFTMPEFGKLRPIQRTQLFIGNNSQLVQRANMNLGYHVPVIINSRKHSPDDLQRIAALGSPVVQGKQAGAMARTADDSEARYQMGTNLQADYVKNMAQVLYEDMYAGIDNNGQPATNTSNVYTTTSAQRHTVVPLKFLNSFCNEKQYLPPSTKMRIELFVATQPTLIWVYSFTTDPQANTVTTVRCFMTITDARFNCVSYILTQSAQEMDNQRWLTTPKVYNYSTFEYVPITTNANQTAYTVNAAINQQRPTDLIWRVFNGTVADGFQTLFPRQGDLTTPDQNGVWQFFNNSVPNVAFGNIRVNIGGRLGYENRYMIAQDNVNLRFQTYMMSQEDWMNEVIQRDVWRGPNEQQSLIGQRWQDMCESILPTMSISPGDMQSQNYYSADQGAVTIFVDIDVMNATLRTPLPAGLQIFVYKKLQEQLLLDAAGSITIVQWPAIKANGKDVKIPITFNQN